MAGIDRHVFAVIGGTGDLARRKLIPALYRLITENGVADRCVLLGVATTNTDTNHYRDWALDALAAAGLTADDVKQWCDANVHYHQITSDADAYRSLQAELEGLEARLALPGNRVFYLALPPPVFPVVITGLGEAGLAQSPGWTRLVIEKPFGTDLKTARQLNSVVHRHFDESSVYRIDHYLGKETVQNLLAFRFANPMFESIWNRDRVESVEITVAEDLGIEGRAGYYEQAGALRDMMQNHLTQLLALVAMEAPIAFEADEIRNEKVKVLRAIAPIGADDVVYGQYVAGTVGGVPVPAYRDEEGVDPGSTTPTFVGTRLGIDTWRWYGVPFFLRTGKRLPKHLTQVAVTFRKAPVCLFHGVGDDCEIHANVLLITLQPDEGFSLLFDVKAPSQPLRLDSQPLHFRYQEAYGNLPDAYQTLIGDIIQGDQTLFVRSDEVEASWKIYTPLLDEATIPHPYEAGTWGPATLDQGLALSGTKWMGR